MKKQVSPAVAVAAIVIMCALVLTMYWKGLLGGKGEAEGPPMGGGGAGMPPPPITGLPTVTVTTPAGPTPSPTRGPAAGFADATGPAAQFDGPAAVAAGPAGQVFVADGRNHRIRVMAPGGAVTTVAGAGPTGTLLGAHADGVAAQARLWNPAGLAVTPDGSVYFTDAGNHRVRRLSGGRVTTVAGGDTPVDSLGLPDGAFADGPGTTARFRYPTGICALPSGGLAVVDTGNRRLRRVAPDGTTTTLADLGAAGLQSPCGIAAAPDGTLIVADPATESLVRVTPVGQVQPVGGIDRNSPIWVRPTGVAVGTDGTIYVADTGSHCVMRILPGGAPEVLAGTVEIDAPAPGHQDGTGDSARFAAPCCLALGPGGALYVADFGNDVIRVISPVPF